MKPNYIMVKNHLINMNKVEGIELNDDGYIRFYSNGAKDFIVVFNCLLPDYKPLYLSRIEFYNLQEALIKMLSPKIIDLTKQPNLKGD